MSFQNIYKCSSCDGKGHIERWAKKRNKIKFNFFRIKTCEYCIGTGINFHKLSNNILIKPVW